MLGIQASALSLGSRGAVFSNGAGLTATYVGFGDAAGKIAGDAGLTYVAASDLLIINHNAAALPATPAANEMLLQVGGLDATSARILIDTFGTTVPPQFVGRSARNTGATPQAVQNADVLVQITALGYGSTAYATAGRGKAYFAANETWTDAAQGTNFQVWTTAATTLTTAVRFSVSSTGATFASGSPVTVSDSTVSSSTTTGALIVTGGAGIAGSLFTGSITCAGLSSSGSTVICNKSFRENGNTITTAMATGSVGFWRSGGTIGTAGDMCLQTDLASTAAAYVFRAGQTTPITIATLSPAVVAGTTPAFSTIGLSTITGGVTDGMNASLRLGPTYDAATALTVTRHNYIDVNQVLLTGAGPAAVTDAPIFRFDAAIGTHKSVNSGTTKTSPGTVTCWLVMNVNGTLHYVPAYSSKTS